MDNATHVNEDRRQTKIDKNLQTIISEPRRSTVGLLSTCCKTYGEECKEWQRVRPERVPNVSTSSGHSPPSLVKNIEYKPNITIGDNINYCPQISSLVTDSTGRHRSSNCRLSIDDAPTPSTVYEEEYFKSDLQTSAYTFGDNITGLNKTHESSTAGVEVCSRCKVYSERRPTPDSIHSLAATVLEEYAGPLIFPAIESADESLLWRATHKLAKRVRNKTACKSVSSGSA